MDGSQASVQTYKMTQKSQMLSEVGVACSIKGSEASTESLALLLSRIPFELRWGF